VGLVLVAVVELELLVELLVVMVATVAMAQYPQ
jgi:hypothetical protein